MSEVTIKGVTWCRVDGGWWWRAGEVDGGWWCTSASRLANGYDADTALDEVVRLREENARLRTAIEEAAAFLVADLRPGANTAVVARLRTAVEAQS